MGIFIAASPPLFLSAAYFAAEPLAPPCPFCQSENTRVIGHNGILGAITLCRCNTCLEEWPETVADDDDEKE